MLFLAKPPPSMQAHEHINDGLVLSFVLKIFAVGAVVAVTSVTVSVAIAAVVVSVVAAVLVWRCCGY